MKESASGVDRNDDAYESQLRARRDAVREAALRLLVYMPTMGPGFQYTDGMKATGIVHCALPIERILALREALEGEGG